MSTQKHTYKDAGVDIDAGEQTVDRIKPAVANTYTPEVLSHLGSFGAIYDAKFPDFQHPVLVSSVDGVGTKLKVAQAMGKYESIGQDLVNHCVNDILVCGAKPLYFLDYYATGKLNPVHASTVIEGMAKACLENNCSLIGGETAEMPGLYEGEDFDLAGMITGVAEKELVLTREGVQAGDIMIGLPSTGLHTNGYSLARYIIGQKKLSYDTYVAELETSIGEALLQVHRSYYKTVYPLILQKRCNGISHITGGGIVGNTMRVLKNGLSLTIDKKSWTIPPIFSYLQSVGQVPEDDMWRTFNLGVGLILIVDQEQVEPVLSHLKNQSESPFIMGTVVSK